MYTLRTAEEIKKEIERIQAKDRSYNNFVNEGGEGYQRDSVPPELWVEIKTATKKEFCLRITKEIFETMRKTWNDYCVANKGQMVKNIKEIETATGISYQDLITAKSYYC